MSAQPSLADLSSAALDSLKKGDNARAFQLSALALQDPKAGHLPCIIFGQSAGAVPIRRYEPAVKEACLAYFAHEKVDHAAISGVWLSMLACDPLFGPLTATVKKRTVTAEDWESLQDCLHDPFLTEGLRRIVIRNAVYEVFFRNLRKLILLELWPKGLLKTRNLPFLCAFAEQCFLNEYVYAVSEAEKTALTALPRGDAVAVGILGCYEPLSRHEINPKLSGVKAFRQMIVTHVSEPQREAALAATIPSPDSISDETSRAVQAMYEENPYPRWRSIDLPLVVRPEVEGSMLIAGCGTGRTATQMGNVFPNLRITACDITRRSIAYAMRMAEKYGNRNVQFEQRDIMRLSSMSERFDFIECSGVLHHMADPVAGWRQLIARMKDDGLMLVCVYSKKAREDVKAVRDHIATRGLDGAPDSIRALRAEIIGTEDHPLKRITDFRDFYTLSEARDLVFHVRETTYTLPELKAIIEGLDLELFRFKVSDAKIRKLYLEKFPDDPGLTNLENWHLFEQEHPLMFKGMYQLILKKRGREPGAEALAILKVAYA